MIFNWLQEGPLLRALLNEFNSLKNLGLPQKEAINRMAQDFLNDRGRQNDGNYNFSVCKKVAIILQIKELYSEQRYL